MRKYLNDNKVKRAEYARKHTEEMSERFSSQIRESVLSTRLYDQSSFSCSVPNKGDQHHITEFIIESIDSVAAIMKYGACSNLAVLNFASYKNPGGMFINGSKAQEECLCYDSFLYNVLKEFKTDYYDWNRKHVNKSLYLDRGLFSSGVLFFSGDMQIECNVITCAAPNKMSAQHNYAVSEEENFKTLKSRIKFILDIALDNYVETLILGAYGCGVFGQNAEDVAEVFRDYLADSYKNCFSKVIFAIPDGRDGNLQAFRNVLGETKFS